MGNNNDEETLTSNLIDPSSLDDPLPPYPKGEVQDLKCRDAWAAILFYAQLIAVCCVCGILGVPAVQRSLKDGGGGQQEEQEGAMDYTGLIYVTLTAAASAFILSTISLTLMTLCPKFLIQLSLLFSLALSLLITATAFYYHQYIAGGFGILFLVLSCCYACCVWSRIPFAAANLNSGLSAVKKNGGVFVMSVMITVMSFGYSVLWMVAWVGVYDATGAASATAAGGEDASSTSFGGYSVLLLLALFWTQQVFQNTIHVIVAGVVSTWWFAPDEASSCCSVAIKDSFVRATTYSFGSICFGSLLVAIIQTLRQVLESIRNNDDTNDGCAAFVVCLVDCLLQCLQGMLEYFNKFAYIYVGMYGYSYLEAGKNVMTLFHAKGWNIIIADDLVSNTLSLFTLIGGGLVGCVGLATNAAFPSWLDGFEGAASGIAFGLAFLIGLVITSIMLSVVDSSVNTVLVSFAEAPEEFELNHPELSGEMRDAWRLVYPAECGF